MIAMGQLLPWIEASDKFLAYVDLAADRDDGVNVRRAAFGIGIQD